MSDTRCGICVGLWSPFPCPHDRSAQMCVCGHHSHDHYSDPSGMAGSRCWHADTYDRLDYPADDACDCRDYTPQEPANE